MTDPLNPKSGASRPFDSLSSTSDLERLRQQLQRIQTDVSAYERLPKNSLGSSLSLANIEKFTRPLITDSMAKLLEISNVSSFANTGKLTWPTISDKLLKQLSVQTDLEELTRQFAEVSGPSAVLAGIVAQHQPFLEATLAFERHRLEVRDLAHLWNISSIRADAQSIFDAIQTRKGQSFEELFRTPTGADFALLDFGAKPGSLSSLLWGNGSDSALLSIGDSLAKMQTKLVEAGDASRSIRAFVELQGLGTALRTLDGFSSQITRGLRIDLGDWRELPKFDHANILEPAARIQLYVEQGLDQNLTDFPDEGFSAGLANAGLSEDYALIAVLQGFVPADASPIEAAAARRNLFGYEVLHRFERGLRDFIDRAMTIKFGPNWPKHRLPGDTYEAWKNIAKAAAEAGNPIPRLIDCADFTDYERIIVRNDNFSDLFGPIFLSKQRVQESFNRLFPLRVATMHARTLTKEDLLYLVAETHRILQAIAKSGF